MTAPAAELQKAIFDALGADAELVSLLGGARIFDHTPAETAFPYITFGRTSVYDWSTGTESGSEHLFTLHIWSKTKGKKETLAIMDRAGACLDDQELSMTGHVLVNLRLEFSEVRYDDDLAVYHGSLRFRAVTEPAA